MKISATDCDSIEKVDHNKKRKMIGIENNSANDYYKPLPPSDYDNIKKHHETPMVEPSSQALSLLFQLIKNPTLTNLLVKQGVLNPGILNHIPTPLIPNQSSVRVENPQ
ncbi:hypothetical protein FRX31_011065 [Thalictrum thalictroides]|uniref:Uncharacterized protein n=1 Tax=Thalictrum thalictroides TaxID=46969 RepID=A0A7J6WQW5_THATH|nr:hypothetical protein FRX31_011065 [Thalictrum thalictroides]